MRSILHDHFYTIDRSKEGREVFHAWVQEIRERNELLAELKEQKLTIERYRLCGVISIILLIVIIILL